MLERGSATARRWTDAGHATGRTVDLRGARAALGRRAQPAVVPRPAPKPRERCEPLDETGPMLGMGRSLTFPFPQWRDADEYRTAFFDEGQGHPLVFVHGLGGNATHFEPILGPLVQRYRVVGLDLPGLGWSRKPHINYTIDLLRDHLLDFVDRHELAGATLVGHSLGGAVCLAAALARPGEFRSVALLCAAGLAPLPGWMRAAAPFFLHRRVLYTTLVLGRNVIANGVFSDRPDENPYVRWFRESSMRDEPGYPNLFDFARVCESLATDVTRRNYSTEFPKLTMPVLAIMGDTDRLTYQPAVMRELGRIRRVRTVVLRRCGHMPMIERPEETLFHLERLLTRPP